jgi:hypothetical protein
MGTGEYLNDTYTLLYTHVGQQQLIRLCTPRREKSIPAAPKAVTIPISTDTSMTKCRDTGATSYYPKSEVVWWSRSSSATNVVLATMRLPSPSRGRVLGDQEEM